MNFILWDSLLIFVDWEVVFWIKFLSIGKLLINKIEFVENYGKFLLMVEVKINLFFWKLGNFFLFIFWSYWIRNIFDNKGLVLKDRRMFDFVWYLSSFYWLLYDEICYVCLCVCLFMFVFNGFCLDICLFMFIWYYYI